MKNAAYHIRVYELVKLIPAGKLASYGMIASLLNGVTARMVGYAMAATPRGQDIPWQRVINSMGKITPRDGAKRQKTILEDEGVHFSEKGRVTWSHHVWQGPDQTWLDQTGLDPFDYLSIKQNWPK